jgi:iron(III) transport system ATP-binding protein
MTELTINGLFKSYGGKPVLTGLDLTVPDGSLTAILGPSGSGKTTLLRVVAGFERADAGTVRLAGRTVDDGRRQDPPETRRIGYVPQEGGLFPHRTVEGNVGFGLRRGPGRRQRVMELLEQVGLAELAGRYPHQLSGGQQQRVALARALAIEPDLVLLDEPFAGLDAHLRAGLRDEVRQILHDAGTTTLLVTHNQDEALSAADFVAVLRDGRIAQQARPHELYTGPADGGLASFVGDANLIDGLLEPGPGGDGHVVVTALGRLPARWHGERPPSPGRVTALLRPEQIVVASANGSEGPLGRVVRSAYYGHDTLLQIQMDSEPSESPLLARTRGHAQLGPGDSCAVGAAGAALVWPRQADPR